MSFVSLGFFVFVAVSFFAYFLFPKKWRWTVLLAASLIFYWLASGVLLVCLLATAMSTYGCALWVERILRRSAEASKDLDRTQRKARKAVAVKKCRWVLAGVLALNFGYLAYLKYNGILYRGLCALGGLWGFTPWDLTQSVLFPLGVSFYTFQSMGYVIDVYRGKVRAERNPLRLLLFVSFFPQIVQGPISRYGQLADQLYEGNDFNYQNAKYGAQLMVWGVFKKLVIADRAAVLVDAVFGAYPGCQGGVLWLGVLFYSFQLYGDFSGGIDIARGVAQIFGIDLEDNFRRPSFATSIDDFWRRWHITLGAWTRDYIFYPLSLSKGMTKASKKVREKLGNRIGKLFPVIVSQFIVFIIIGMWHGSEVKYIGFGLYHALLITAGILFEEPLHRLTDKLHVRRDSWWFHGFQILRTFVLVMYGRFFSRALSFRQSVSMMGACFLPWAVPEGFQFGLVPQDYWVLGVALLVLFVVEVFQERGVVLRDWLSQRPAPLRWAVYVLGLMIVLIFGAYGKSYIASDFIYMRI